MKFQKAIKNQLNFNKFKNIPILSPVKVSKINLFQNTRTKIAFKIKFIS